MTRATVLQEVRQMRFEELYERRQRLELTMRKRRRSWGSRSGRFAGGATDMKRRGRWGWRIGGLGALRRGAHRKKRPRKPLPGMMLHQDGSTHE